MKRFSSEGISWLLVLLAVLAGLTALVLATRWGPGITPDTVVYVDAARHLTAGDGLVTDVQGVGPEPLTQYPPLFPMLLAALASLGVEPLAGARVLNLVLFAANVLLVFLALRTAMSSSSWLPLVGAVLMASSWQILLIHANALTEPVFLCFGSAGLVLLGRFLERPRFAWLMSSAVCVGLAFLSRYAGVSLVAAGTLGLLLLGGGPLIRRLAHACAFSVVAALPMGLWLANRSGLTEDPVGRTLLYHPIQPNRLEAGIDHLFGWLLLDGLPWWVQAGLLLGVIGSLLHLGCRAPASPAERRWAALKRRLGMVPGVFAIFAGVYVVFLIFSLSFVDALTPLNHRILSPIFVSLLIVVLRTAFEIFRARPTRPTRLAGVALVALLVLGYALQTVAWSARSHSQGLPGYASRAWRESPLIDRITQLGDKVQIYSNGPDAISILAGRSTRWLPRKWDPVSRRPRGDFAEQLAAMQGDLAASETLIVWFDWLSWRRYVASPKELLGSMPLQRAEAYPDGTVFRSR